MTKQKVMTYNDAQSTKNEQHELHKRTGGWTSEGSSIEYFDGLKLTLARQLSCESKLFFCRIFIPIHLPPVTILYSIIILFCIYKLNLLITNQEFVLITLRKIMSYETDVAVTALLLIYKR